MSLCACFQNQENNWFSSVQSLSSVRLFATPWRAAHQASVSFTISWCLLKLKFIEQVMPSSSIFPSVRVFSNELALHIRWPKYWSFSFSISPFNEYSGLISFRMKLVSSPCCPRDSQESSPAPQSESINSLALSLLCGPALIFVRDYCKNHSFDYTDLCQQS